MSDYEAIQGTWKVVSGSKEGLTIPIGPKKFGSKVLYELNPSKTPKEIDLKHRRPRARRRSSGRGIYSLDGDTMTLCWVYEGERPKTFAASGDSEQNLLVLKRVRSTS